MPVLCYSAFITWLFCFSCSPSFEIIMSSSSSGKQGLEKLLSSLKYDLQLFNKLLIIKRFIF